MSALLLLAVALAIDAMAVSASLACGPTSRRMLVGAVAAFGLFQAGMSGLGAVGGDVLATYAASWDHWIAFVLLLGVGGRMAKGVASPEPEGSEGAMSAVGVRGVLALAVATSIDALASGVSLPLLGPSIAVSVVVIGLVTVALSGTAATLANRLTGRFSEIAERIGGVVLILIGTRILVIHMIDHGPFIQS
ncbi:MAG: manganese efflux pump MntP family protein [Myxococcota bacterium]